MNASLARGTPHGYEVGYDYFSINGRMLGHGEPIRVRRGQRVLLHVLNGSAGEIRSLAMPGSQIPGFGAGRQQGADAGGGAGAVDRHRPNVSPLWSRWTIPASGCWATWPTTTAAAAWASLSSTPARRGTPRWAKPAPFKWDYTMFGTANPVPPPDQVVDLVFAKDNATDGGFNRWTINGAAYPDSMEMARPMLLLAKGRPLPTAHAQRQRRHPPHPPAPPQLRAGTRRRQTDLRSGQGRGHAGRLPGGRI